MTKHLYIALIREPAPKSYAAGSCENLMEQGFDDLMAQIDRSGWRLILLHHIDFDTGTVEKFMDAEATFDAWMRGEDYENSPAGLFDMRTEAA